MRPTNDTGAEAKEAEAKETEAREIVSQFVSYARLSHSELCVSTVCDACNFSLKKPKLPEAKTLETSAR